VTSIKTASSSCFDKGGNLGSLKAAASAALATISLIGATAST
jgi:hypothetical protein